MTTGNETARRALTFGWDSEEAQDTAGRFLARLRPADGWIALLLLVANLCVVVMSVERADWAPTPSLVGLLLLAMLTAFVFHKLPVWWWLALLPGLALGALTVIWQISGFSFDGEPLGGTGALWERLGLWWEAADTGSINIDKVPFSFGLSVASWLTGFLGAWLFLRHRNFWGVFVLGGLGLLSNLTFLPPHTNLHLALYLFTALLLVARVQAVRRQGEWERRGIRYDEGLRALTLSDSFFITIAVLLVAFLLPVWGNWNLVTNGYEAMRKPLTSYEDDFNRLFAGLPARRAIGFRVWDDVMAFQGTINPATTLVLQVHSPAPLYWKARTYATYTSKGWISEETEYVPVGELPGFTSSDGSERVQVRHSVVPLYDSKVLFSGGRIVAVDREAEAEIVVPPADSTSGVMVSGVANEGIRTLLKSIQAEEPQSGADVQRKIAGFPLPSHVDVTVKEGASPPPPDVLSVRARNGVFPAYEPYEVTSSVSAAEPEQLREAGSDYPLHVATRYTQLTRDLPQRVKELAVSLTADAETPYDKALAVEAYLKTLPYNLQIEPPPYDADGVDHFLFEQGQGYSEYFASSMAVLLRSVGIPARVAVGYTTGDQVESEPVYAVTDSHSHGWVEVYFPGYDWIPFEPTPGAALPVVMVPGGIAGEELEGPFLAGLDFDCIDEFDLECGVPLEPLPGEGGLPGEFADGGTFPPWVWAIIVLAAVAASGLAGRWAYRRHLAPAQEPDTVYGRLRGLAAFGGLNAAGPRTPYQFGQQLGRRLPAYRESVDVIVDSYVRSRYGARTLSPNDRERLTDAWLGVRYPLLRLSLLRRARIL